MNYKDLFQCLKGVSKIDLSSFVLPVNGTGYTLCPIRCNRNQIDASITRMLTNARNANPNSFLTHFNATPEQTHEWLINKVGSDSSRILFAVKELNSRSLYGYMGLACGNADGTEIEGDAIVRFEAQAQAGLMRKAFLQLVHWVHDDVGITCIKIRVLSDNSAVSFYKRCGFIIASEAPLYETRDNSGVIEELSEIPKTIDARLSKRTLFHMTYAGVA